MRFGDDPSKDPEVHQGEYIVLEFTDGTALEIETGSNSQSIAWDLEEGRTKTFKTSDFPCSFVPVFHEDGDVRHKPRQPEATK